MGGVPEMPVRLPNLPVPAGNAQKWGFLKNHVFRQKRGGVGGSPLIEFSDPKIMIFGSLKKRGMGEGGGEGGWHRGLPNSQTPPGWVPPESGPPPWDRSDP